MKKLFNGLKALAIVLGMSFILTGCSEEAYDFYSDYVAAGATISQENIYESITLTQAKEKIDAKEEFVLILSTSLSSTAVSQINRMQNAADYLDYSKANGNKPLYVLNMTDLIDKRADRDEVKNTLGIYKTLTTTTEGVIVAIYGTDDAGFGLKIDSSNLSSDKMENFVNSAGTLNLEALTSYILCDLN